MKYILGFDIGGSKSAVVLGDSQGQILRRIESKTLTDISPETMIDRLVKDAAELRELATSSGAEISGIGIACGGPLDRKKGVIMSPPNLPGWDDIPVVEMLNNAFDMPAVLENDADACALAEFLFGAGLHKNNVISLTWGTGIGSGLILGDKLYTGSSGGAGEVGHICWVQDGRQCVCGKRGCVEAYGSASSIVRIAREALDEGASSMLERADELNCEAICNAAREGDKLAANVVTQAGTAMGHAVAVLAQLFDPDVITLGTLAHRAPDVFMPTVEQKVREDVWPNIRKDLLVVPSPLGERIQDLSPIAAFLARFQ